MDPLKICFISSEIVPFAKTGGLADVSGALGKYLDQAGHDVRLFMPLYDKIDTDKYDMHVVDFLQNITLNFNGFDITFTVVTTKLPDSNADVYLIHCPDLYHRGSIYTEDHDEYLRFVVLVRAVIESCQRMGWGPDVFHCNDWQSAMLPFYLKTVYQWDDLFANSRTILTIHNIGYQGIFGSDRLGPLNLQEWAHMLPQDDLADNMLNYMKTGLLLADVITTVSNTYAREIQTAEYGAGMEYILQQRSDHLIGIVNGVDYEDWNPETDEHLTHKYSSKRLAGKEKNKKELLESFNLPYRKGVPLFSIISRLTVQKGFDILEEILFEILQNYDLQFIVLGSGDDRYARLFHQAQYHFPQKFGFYEGYHIPLSHKIEAGSDIFVMPSRYEPCGLNQIYSLKYGTVPIVRKTGGLADTVEFYDWESDSGTGFVFEYYNSDSLKWAIDYAYTTYQHRDTWKRLMKRGMAQNFSWELQVQKYVDLYQHLVGVS